MAVRLPSSFELINTEQRELSTAIQYKSGAYYEGDSHENTREGSGLFSWPNGDRYDGAFHNNKRHGFGVQIWASGDSFQGEYVEDYRQGKGVYKWENGDVYRGCFYKDHRHGYGSYTWADGSSYTGTFYLDRKEGYGKVQYQNGSVFEGLFKDDDRFGPGVLTYTDDKQDVGFWRRFKLVRILDGIPDAFTLETSHSIDYVPEEKIDLDLEDSTDPLYTLLADIVDPPDEFDYYPEVTGTLHSRLESVILKETDNQSEGFDRAGSNASFRAMDEEFNKEDAENPETPSKTSIKSPSKTPVSTESLSLKAWNNTPTAIEMQKHILKFEYAQERVSFPVDKLILNDRSAFKEKGQLEEASWNLIQASMEGEFQTIRKLLNEDNLDPNVSDNQGISSLYLACLNFHIDIMNFLLDYGADINILSNEGLSCLNACMLLFYPLDKFHFNTAENPQNIYPVEESPVKKKIRPPPKEDTNSSRAKESLQTGSLEVEMRITDSLAPSETIPSRFTGALCRGKQIDFAANSDFWRIEERSIDDSSKGSVMNSEEFDSQKSLSHYPATMNEQLITRCATQLSHNEMVVSKSRTSSAPAGDPETIRKKAVELSEQEKMSQTIRLLLQRGADPNMSSVPMPVLFFSVKAMDVGMVRELLLRGVDTNVILTDQRGGLSALHIAVALPGEAGVQITELLLDSLAQPDARALPDESFLDKKTEDEWSKDELTEDQERLLGGRTPLHVACARDDDYKNSYKLVRLLLKHKANPDLLCNGHSSITLAITSGNDLAIEELLRKGADPSLPCSHGVGSALCAASSTVYEHRRTLDGRINLINRLMKAGADILAPVAVSNKRTLGTAVDYAHHVYNLDRRISQMPYHALSLTERDTFNERRRVLAHIGNILREKAVEKEKMLMDEGQFQLLEGSQGEAEAFIQNAANVNQRRDGFKYCYDCGRSVGVRLTACTRCKEVYFCGKACKLKAWNTRHKDECVKVAGGTSAKTRTNSRQIDSPTPATDADGAKKGHIGKEKDSRMKKASSKTNPNAWRSKSAGATPAPGSRNSNFARKPKFLSKTPSHPAYSYQYINGVYVKVNAQGQIIRGNALTDNYSFN